jgi:molybdenum cofactor biosynthesis enzyme MoaA
MRQNFSNVDLNFFEEIEIDISNVCNLKCPLCHRESATAEKYDLSKKVELSLVSIKRIAKLFPNLKRFYLGFLICEPTLHSEFVEIVKFLKASGKKITLSTNGNTKANKKDDKFWEDFLSLLEPDDKIIWPVDGFNQEVYEQYRKSGKLSKVLYNIDRALKINPNINHTIQTIIFNHNQEHIRTDYEDFKKLRKANYQLIDCCGDCSLNSDEVVPAWDKEQWRKIRANPPKSKNIICESKENRIIFVDHLGRIGFCPTQLTNSVMVGQPAQVTDRPDTILNYINETYNGRDGNKICQFNCGKMAKLKKQKYNLSGIHTK